MTLASIGLPYIPGWNELRPFWAELILVASIVSVLVAPFFSRKSNTLCALIALSGLLLALLSLLLIGCEHTTGTFFRSLLLSDPVAYFWKILLLIFASCIVLLWFVTASPSLHEGDGPEFFTLLLGATLGMCLMVSTTHLLMLVMAIEMASLPSYVLAGFRKTHRVGAEASLKYVLFGAVTSSIMIFGVSLLYGLFGTLQWPDLAAKLLATTSGSALLVVGLSGLIVGIGFKISAVPFHFWCPDVFEGASIEVSAFLSVASKGAALLLLLRLTQTLAQAGSFADSSTLGTLAVLIGLLGAISATVGNTAAFFQQNIKRLLAYSSIAHAGYMLCAVSLLIRGNRAEAGFDPSAAAAQALLLYLAVYLFMNLGAFSVAGVVWRETGSEDISAFAGLGKRSPVLALCMAVFMFSLVGLPPLAGFTAKVNILWALIQNGSYWWILVGVIGLNTIISLYFYARVVKVMYLEDSEAPEFVGQPIGLALSVGSAVLLLVLFLGWNGLTNLTSGYDKLYMAPAGNAVPGMADVTPHPASVVLLPDAVR